MDHSPARVGVRFSQNQSVQVGAQVVQEEQTPLKANEVSRKIPGDCNRNWSQAEMKSGITELFAMAPLIPSHAALASLHPCMSKRGTDSSSAKSSRSDVKLE